MFSQPHALHKLSSIPKPASRKLVSASRIVYALRFRHSTKFETARTCANGIACIAHAYMNHFPVQLSSPCGIPTAPLASRGRPRGIAFRDFPFRLRKGSSDSLHFDDWRRRIFATASLSRLLRLVTKWSICKELLTEKGVFVRCVYWGWLSAINLACVFVQEFVQE